MRILLIDADRRFGDIAQRYLNHAGFAVDWLEGGRDAFNAVQDHHYEIVVLSMDLPGDEAMTLLHKLKSSASRVPVVVTSLPGDKYKPYSLLDFGADDFLRKPFDMNDLAARVRITVRRATHDRADSQAHSHGRLKLSPMTHSVTLDGTSVALTHREYSVLEVLVRRKNQVLTRAQIEEALYGWNDEVASNAVEVHIHMLRRKLGTALIRTVRGVGYQLQ